MGEANDVNRYKLVPTFLRSFEMELVNPQEYKTYCAWFVRHLNFNTKFRPRQTAEKAS